MRGMNQESEDQTTPSLSPREYALLHNPIPALMWQLGLPAVIGMMVIGLYPLVDGIFAGRIIGESAMAAMSTAAPITYVNNGIATLVGTGSASMLSRAIGARDEDTIQAIMGNSIFWVTLLSLVTTACGIIFAPQLISIMGAEGEIATFGARYLRVLFIGSLFVNFAQASNMLMRAEGRMKSAMMLMMVGAILNIVLDPIFMLAMGDYAIEGAAIASVIAQVSQAMVTIWFLRTRGEVVRLARPQMSRAVTPAMMSLGVSVMMMQILSLVQQVFQFRGIYTYGGFEHGVIMSATMRVMAFSFIPLWGLAQGLQPIVGTNIGAGKTDRVREAMTRFTLVATAMAATFWLPIQLVPHRVLTLFGVSPEIVDMGVPFLRTAYSVFILAGFLMMAITYFQAIGYAKAAAGMVFSRQLILFVPTILILPTIMGVWGVWIAGPIVDTVVIIAAGVMVTKSFQTIKSVSV